MKRCISLLLTLLTLLFCVCMPVNVFAKEESLDKIYDLYVFVPNNKAKTLCLTWYEDQNKPDGYQIYRSDSGKAGTYRKIATTTKPTFTDSGLKNQTVYYYAVRAFAKNGNKTVYSPFAKRDCFTKITKSYAAKLLKNGYEIYQKWITRNTLKLNYGKQLKFKEVTRMDDGTIFDFQVDYYPVLDKTITTKKALSNYLNKYFTDWAIGEFVDAYYVEHNGRLYAREPDFVDGIGQVYEQFKIRDIAQKDDFASFSVLETWTTYTGDFPVMAAYELFRFGNRWLFSDNSWFPQRLWIERKLAS